jgi:hypothetical protein
VQGLPRLTFASSILGWSSSTSEAACASSTPQAEGRTNVSASSRKIRPEATDTIARQRCRPSDRVARATSPWVAVESGVEKGFDGPAHIGLVGNEILACD